MGLRVQGSRVWDRLLLIDPWGYTTNRETIDEHRRTGGASHELGTVHGEDFANAGQWTAASLP